MDRRTFVLLTGAASAALWRPRLRHPPGLASLPGSLRFDLDDQRRLALWYNAPDRSIPLLRNAALGVWIGDTLVTLADLEDVSVGNRRPPGGESLVIRGRTPAPAGTASGSVWIEAAFLASDSGAHGAITITVYPDRVLATIRGIQCFATSEPQVLPGDGALVALVSGYQSWSACHTTALPADATSYSAIGVARAGHGLGAVWDAGEAGEGKVKLTADGTFEAVSEWSPGRPVRPDGDGTTLRLAYVPAGDALAALSAAAAPQSSVDRERVAALAVPTGWCSWYELGADVSEPDILANIDFCAAHFDRRFFRYIQLDDGYQHAAGDWNTNAKFPHGHRWLTDRIHAAGFQAGLWVAPFAVGERADVTRANPAWLLKGPPPEGAPLVLDNREPWGGRIFALDGAHPDVQQWLYDLARRAVREWGYDYLKVDFLEWATAGVSHYGGLTRAEAYRSGLTALRDGLGTEAFLLGCGAPLQHAAGLVDGMRIGDDVDASWDGIQSPARAAGLRSFYNRSIWLNDPDCLVVRPPLTVDEARVWASVVAISGGMSIFSDNLPKLPAERLPLLQKTIPVASPPPTAAPPRPIGTQNDDPEIAPALTVGDSVVRLKGPWRFRTGDDAGYAGRDFDDDAWETIPVPMAWEQAGHPDYDGHAWYRTRFMVPAAPAAPPLSHLDLGKIDDRDETFVNGVRVGTTNGWRTYRRYAVPPEALNWGGENVLAVHVIDGGGAGGLWSVTRDRPAATWIVEGAERWWTLALINWDDEPRSVAQSIDALGISGREPHLATFDVWTERPLPDVQQTLSATIAPHSTLTVALRPSATHPQIIGTTRHVVQGAIDIAEEHWDAAARALRAKCVNLDGRLYAVTIAVPRGLRARACTSSIACTLKRLETGHAVLEWPAGTTTDLEWSLSFGSAARR